MNISLVTPASKHNQAGNWTTAVRWARILRTLGHKVTIRESDEYCDSDMMIAVHAWRSAESIARFANVWPNRPLVVCMAGTDIYQFQHSHPHETQYSMDAADVLVCLNEMAQHAIPERFHGKLRIIHQSAQPLVTPRKPSIRTFDVYVIGHLRDEKDPLRAAYAARLMPSDSRLRIVQLGRAHSDYWENVAKTEMAENSRFIWHGEVPRGEVRRHLSRSQAMVISSVSEGGANVVSEAIIAGVPVIASDIQGNIGLLGHDYVGRYPVGDTEALANMLSRAEREPGFLEQIRTQCDLRAPMFSLDGEMDAWYRLLRELTGYSRIEIGAS